MNSIVKVARTAIVIYAGAAMLAACSGQMAGTSALPPAGDPQARLSPLGGTQPNANFRAWMSPDAAATKELLYVSDAATNVVSVYDYSTGKTVGLMTGFDHPSGQCVEPDGHVWVASTNSRTLLRFAHGVSDPIVVLHTAAYPVGCSVSSNGDLAVAEQPGPSNPKGELTIWRGARTLTARYDVCPVPFPPGYDDKGNLFVECKDGDLTHVYIRRTSDVHLRPISLVPAIRFPGGAMWDGKYMTLTDQRYDFHARTAIYRVVAASGPRRKLKVVSASFLADSCDAGDTDVLSPFIVGTKNTPVNDQQGRIVLGSNHDCTGTFDFWTYPGGGDPAMSLKLGPASTTGQSVSIAE
ncbi:MAG TPA: hypothetical protein VMU38_03940 [Candidatus Binatia bacterium]|nr:hypothetical protein [Candidatus Binatia bacterium]